MTQPPYGSDPNRPQDTPRSFPTYGRPEHPHAQEPGAQEQPGGPAQLGAPQQTDAAHLSGEPQQSGGLQQFGAAQESGTQWAAPGQPPATVSGQAPYGQSRYEQTPYGPGMHGQSPYGQGPAGPAPYGQAGQPSYGQGYGPGQYPAAYGQAPYSYGYGYAGTTGGTNGLATAALATGIGGIFFGLAAPVAIGLGIAALVQISRRREGGKGMAIAGLTIGSVVTLGYMVLFGFLFAIGSTADDYGAPEPVSTYSGSTVHVDDLAVGECYDDGGKEGEAIRRPCSAPHDGEIIADVTLPEGPYPGDRGVDKMGDSSCSTEFGKYVGTPIDDSELDIAWWTPTRSLWNSNDRMVVCAAYGPDGDQLTGTVKNTHR